MEADPESSIPQSRGGSRRAPGRQLAAKEPEGLADLLKDLKAEQEQGVTYGASAEHREFQKQFQKARERGDRLVILGKQKGSQLKALLQQIDPTIDVSEIRDDVNYGGDLMIIGLEKRELENWVRHLTLWGFNDGAGVITKTVQMKWGESPVEADTEYQISYAGIQLSGARDESALPFGHKEISVGILNPAQPWNALNASNAAATIIPSIARAFTGGEHRGKHGVLYVPKEGLYQFVTKIVIRTKDWTFRFIVNGLTIQMTSATATPDQHASLLAEPRPGKLAVGVTTKSGRLLNIRGQWIIQLLGTAPGQKKFIIDPGKISALQVGTGALQTNTNVDFDVNERGEILAIRKET